MPSTSGDNSNSKIDLLRRREAALKTAIAQERVRQQKCREKEHRRLASVVGECLLADLDAMPQMRALFEESLKRHASPRDAGFLRARGWNI